jgi:hypothetical protein
MSRKFITAAELEPNAPTPCFCSSCMELGGRRRELLRDKWLRSLRNRVTVKRETQAERPR